MYASVFMPLQTVSVRKPNMAMLAVRVILITVLVTLICFVVSLFLSIVGILIAGMIRGGIADMTVAYRSIAFPIALGAMVIGFIVALVSEIKHYRKMKTDYEEWKKAA
jgi:uncharacterized membrane protein